MPKSRAKQTTAANLDAKFNAGDHVLDYFDLSTAKVMLPTKLTSQKPERFAMANQGTLRRALEIAAEIEKLGGELSLLLGVPRAKQAHAARNG